MKKSVNRKLGINLYQSQLLYKKKISNKNYYLIKWPVFSKQVFVFEIQGLMNRTRYKSSTCNQTMTLGTLVSKNNVYLNIPVQCPAILLK